LVLHKALDASNVWSLQTVTATSRVWW